MTRLLLSCPPIQAGRRSGAEAAPAREQDGPAAQAQHFGSPAAISGEGLLGGAAGTRPGCAERKLGDWRELEAGTGVREWGVVLGNEKCAAWYRGTGVTWFPFLSESARRFQYVEGRVKVGEPEERGGL